MKNQEIQSLIKIDLRSGIPAYLQIIQQIQGLIIRRVLQPGDQLPTVRQLAEQLAINFNTIARAYRLMDKSGLITTQRGRGTYVLESSGSQDRLRDEMLVDLIANFIAETERLGYSAVEVRQAFYQQIRRREDTPMNG